MGWGEEGLSCTWDEEGLSCWEVYSWVGISSYAMGG